MQVFDFRVVFNGFHGQKAAITILSIKEHPQTDETGPWSGSLSQSLSSQALAAQIRAFDQVRDKARAAPLEQSVKRSAFRIQPPKGSRKTKKNVRLVVPLLLIV